MAQIRAVGRIKNILKYLLTLPLGNSLYWFHINGKESVL